MSRLFDDAQSEYLKIDQVVLASMPCAYVCWFNADAFVLNHVLMIQCDKDANVDTQIMYINKTNGTFQLRAYQESGVSGGSALSSLALSTSTWHHACAIFASATDRRILTDGANKGTNSTNIAPANLDRTAIGYWATSSPNYYMSGRIAEVAIYDLSGYPGATGSDKADYFEANVLPDLAAAEPPSSYSTGLEAYWSLETSSLEDEADGFDLTASGTTFSYEHPSVYRNLDGTIDSQSAVAGNLQWLKELTGTIGAQSALTGKINEINKLIGLVEGQSALTGNITSAEGLSGSLTGQSGLTGNLQWLKLLAGSIGAESTVGGNLQWLQELAGLIESQSTVSGSLQWVKDLAGSLAGQSGLTGNINITKQLNGSIVAQATLTAKLRDLSSLSGTIDAQVTVAGNLSSIQALAGLVAGQSNVLGLLQSGYKTMPPAMHEALIDPYSGGAWLRLIEIRIPGYDIIRLARNPIDVVYSGVTYDASNLGIKEAALTGDGSVPRTLIKVVQDAAYTLEDKINATRGAGGGTIKIIKAHEDFLDKFIAELEQTIRILTADSDTNHVIFQLGIPNLFIKKIPLRRYMSKICPWHLPPLFKSIRCQYAGADPTCGGKYTDCLDKGNEIHFGADLGLDPNATKV